jgi:predicted dehydrogenase
MSKLRCGVIGLGIGRSHIRGYQSHPDAEVVAVADLDEARRSAVMSEFGIEQGYASGEDMIREAGLDVVSIGTPNSLHKPLTLAALDAGCHVLCEKPMALTAEEAREMQSAADAAGKRLMINFSFRFTDASQAMKAIVDEGALGEVYFGRSVWHRRFGAPKFGGWFGHKAMSGGGPLIDLGVHRLDLALWLMGYPTPTWVMGSTYDHLTAARAKAEGAKFDVEDLAAAMIKFDNGATLELEASWAAHIAEDQLMETRLLGTDGGLLQSNLEGTYKFEAHLYKQHDGIHRGTRIEPLKPLGLSAMKHFVQAIRDDTLHEADGSQGLLVMQLLDAIYASAASGEPVRVG